MAKRVLLDIHSAPAWYTLAGISCHLRDYRLSYLINDQLSFQLVRLEDLPYLPPGTKEPVFFSLYKWTDDDRYNTYYLIANRSEDVLLAPQVKQADFLMLIEGPFKKQQQDEFLSRLRKVPNILTAFPVSFSAVRNYESILTDLEIHLNERSEGD
jgi:hypothetical protein